MKNSSMYTALAAFIAFIGAAVYAMLFLMELLPSGFLFALTGIVIALAVLVLLTFSAAYCGCKAKHCLHNSLACFGKALIFAAVATLCISILLLTLTPQVTPFYAAILFLTVFFWKFLLIIWGFSLAVTIPCYCYIDDNCPSADTTAAENTCANNSNTTSCYGTAAGNCAANGCYNQNNGYANSRYNY